jgi:hypothetical protein
MIPRAIRHDAPAEEKAREEKAAFAAPPVDCALGIPL